MTGPTRPVRRRDGFAAIAAAALLVAACASPPQVAPVASELPFDQAADQATDNLAGQTQKLPTFLAKLAKRSVVLDPMLDAATGQQTHATNALETRVSERLTTKFASQFELLPFQSTNLGKAQYLLTGTMTRVDGDGSAKKRALQINLALTELARSPRRVQDRALPLRRAGRSA